MNDLHARTVFFARNAQNSLHFYTQRLGFTLNWSHEDSGRALVCQVSLRGFQLILNQVEPGGAGRAGCGRVFIGLEPGQVDEFRRHLRERGIEPEVVRWGEPTLVVKDLDQNELFIWLPDAQRRGLEQRLAHGPIGG
jgi:catechol 2,3-dioxygenase-like lactoylglutathione lyase family enzyme